MALTELTARSLKGLAKPYKRSDGKGLYLEISPSGVKLWRFKFRFGGREKRISLGRYPEVSLRDARQKRDEARKLIEDGTDPSVERQRQKIMASLSAVSTFQAVAEEYVEKKLVASRRAAVTVDKARWLIRQFTSIARRPIAEIKPYELLTILQQLEAAGKRETARRCRSFASRVFRYAIVTMRCEHDPASVLLGALTPPNVKHHAALIDPRAVGKLLAIVEDYGGSPVTRYAITIGLHVFLRPGELRLAQWGEIDLEDAIWRVPAERAKMRKPHAVPLSRQVVEMLRDLRRLTGPNGYAFPAFHTPKRPMSENTVNTALRRLGYGPDEMTAHGMRSTASTLLNDCGKWNPDAIERSLAHVSSTSVRAIYNRGEYWGERVEMHQWWSDYLDRLRTLEVEQRQLHSANDADAAQFEQAA